MVESPAHATHSLDCTLLANWESGYADPWLILTDLSPQQAQICWYSMRSWIECLFKDIKRGGLGWHHTFRSDPGLSATLREQRAERLWLAIATATLWLVSVGGETDGDLSASSLSDNHGNNKSELDQSPSTATVQQTSCDLNQPTRYLSCFRQVRPVANLIRRL
ncbi:hypothetical protein [Moorena sp. SIO1G6]|uniref:hypothetical protein n=1 Tax=Moorena sp. SIO1G6 TaxID=2607840 RepID=UPI00257A9731|nr:hypothetical protein [Moorena sp. SIO1G6]